MNILIITPDIYPFQRGYGGRNPLNLFDAFSRSGHTTFLLASVLDREWNINESAKLTELFEIVRLHSIEFVPAAFDYFSLPYIQDILKIRKLLHSNHYDVIILNDYFWSLSFLSILLMGRRNRSRTIMINHGIISPKGHGSKYLFNVFSVLVSKIFIRQFLGILSYSRMSHAAISKIVKPYGRFHVRPSCIDSGQFSIDYENASNRFKGFLPP